MDQLDVVTAFLYGEMTENVFCAVPDDGDVKDNFDCMALAKAVYG